MDNRKRQIPKAKKVKHQVKSAPKGLLELKQKWKQKKLNKFNKSTSSDTNEIDIEHQPYGKHSDECDLCWKCHKILGSFEQYVCFDCKMANYDKRVHDKDMGMGSECDNGMICDDMSHDDMEELSDNDMHVVGQNKHMKKKLKKHDRYNDSDEDDF